MHIKIIYSLILISLSFFYAQAKAQKDTLIYYLKASGKRVAVKDSADLLLYIMKPNNTVAGKLFIVKEYYPDGKIGLMGRSVNNKLPLQLQGPCVAFFQNGQKSTMMNFKNGELSGSYRQYYPNGRFYYEKNYSKTSNNEKKIQMTNCRDSTGKIVTENGNGDWIEFNDDYTKIIEQGPVVNGLKNGVWDKIGLYRNYKVTFKDGMEINSEVYYSPSEKVPEFISGLEAFGKFIGRNVGYPLKARQNGTQGKVFVKFIVNEDGSLSDAVIVKGIGDGCDEEVLRIIKLSPKWIPETQNGKAIKASYTIPITFGLGY